MKIQPISISFFLMTALFLMIPNSSSADETGGMISYISLAFETITKVEQKHNPGVGSNHIDLSIEGKAGGKLSKVSISINSSGSGSQNIFDACRKNAMMALHYSELYTFEIASGAQLNDNNLSLNIDNSGGDYIICSLNIKNKYLHNLPLVNSNTMLPLSK